MGKEKLALAWLLICQFCNFADAFFTLYAVSKGVKEANPVMAWAIETSPLFFAITKLVVFTLAIDYIASRRPWVLRYVALLLMCVVAWHISFVFNL
tara:strand:- start:459 stop:746 length:288 start_codon:yes stop_codon:yes gene_type:complete